jgi:hypothetical protein
VEFIGAIPKSPSGKILPSPPQGTRSRPAGSWLAGLTQNGLLKRRSFANQSRLSFTIAPVTSR